MDNIGKIPPGSANGLSTDLRPAHLRREPAQQATPRPVHPPTRAASDTTAISRQALSNAAAYARGAAQVLPDEDPLKGFATGLSSDLAGDRGETFSSAGRLGALHNAHAFALAANNALQHSGTLKGIR
tara:strand:+ start:277 stop:660 length:384 start_codon:yes stop_codon:yes gene_type:complete